MPVLETLLVTAVGLVLGMESINLLGTISRQYLNKLVFFVFTPSLIVSALADTITLDGLGTLWFMLVNVLITFLIGSALAWILIKITRAPQHLQSLIIGCCAAGNLGNLLLIILPAVCEGDDSPFGDSSVCSTDAEAYAALSIAVIVHFSYSKITKINKCYSKLSLISEEFMDQVEVQSTGPEGKVKVSSSMLWFHFYNAQKLSSLKVTFLEKTMLHLKKLIGHVDLKKLFAPSTIAAVCS
ncbi:hypothetical protein I3842_14G016900 [Carya illinoinensis]|uniref:PIN-like protein n=1 Tax=Carya illinoinensis TaxID=32201 RepID=A0A922D887_CARIL|nr:hypothetical protein I3842_14G016900 [Carya illinoinensis]